MRGPVESFRPSFWWLFFYVMGCATGIGVPLAVGLVLVLSPGPVNWRALLFAVAGAMGGADVAAVVLLLGYVAYFRVQVGPDELRATNGWALYRTIAWSDVTSVRTINMLGLKTVLVRADKAKTTLWVPLFLSDLERFYLAVQDHAGPDHPLALALQAELM